MNDPATLLDSIGDACYAVDSNWRFTFINREAEALFGMSRSEVLGRNVWEQLPDIVALGVRSKFEEAVTSGRVVSFSVYSPSRDRWFALRALPHESGLLAILHTEDQPAHEERRFRALVEKAMDGITLVNADLIPFYRSPSGSEILGYLHETAQSERGPGCHPDDLPAVRRATSNLGHGESTTLEFRAAHADGSWRWVRGAFTNRLTDPAIGGIVINFRDITEERRLREEAELHQAALAEGNQQLKLGFARLATLHRVHQAATGSHETHSTVADILDSSLKGTGARAVVLVEQAGELQAMHRHDSAEAMPALPDQPLRELAKQALRDLAPVSVDLADSPADSALAQLAATGLQNAQAVPFVRGGLRGALVLLTPRAIHHDFGSGSYLVTVTGYVANALETQKLLDDLKRSADDYSALARFGQQIETITDIDELASHGLRELVSQLRVHYATLASVEDGFAVPRWRAGEAGPQAQRLLEQPIPLDRGVVAQAVATGEPVLVQDYRSYDQRPHYLRNLNFASVLALPFDTGSTGEFVFIFASTDQDQPIAETSVAIAALFAKRMANAFERVAQIAEVKATREETFRALGLALEYRDYETKGHTDRVVLYTERFGQLLGYDNASLVPLRWGAYLHDIGKLSIPDHILLKAGPLTDAEFSVIRQHPITGEELSREVSFLPDVTHHMVRHHHEKWDGSGYPDGLQGDEVPIEARLFALVDVYDALTSKRPYRPAWSEDRARTYMKEQSGKHFDPELLARFLDLIRHPPRAPGG